MVSKFKKTFIICLVFMFALLQVASISTKVFAVDNSIPDYSTGYTSDYYLNIIEQDKDLTLVRDTNGLFAIKGNIKTQIDLSNINDPNYLSYLGKTDNKYYFYQPFKKDIYVLDTTTNKLVFDSKGPSFGKATDGMPNNWAFPQDYIFGVIDNEGTKWFIEYYMQNNAPHWAICNSKNPTVNLNVDDSKGYVYLTKGLDGSIWFMQYSSPAKLCKINPDNSISKFSIQGDNINNLSVNAQGDVYYNGDGKIYHYTYADGKLNGGDTWGVTDGISLDHYGNLWSASQGVLYQVFSKDGQKPEMKISNQKYVMNYIIKIYDKNHLSVVPYKGETSTYRIINSGDFIAPEVTNLASSYEGGLSLKLTWNASVENNKNVNYIIYRDGEKLDTSNTNSYTDNKLSYDTEYKYSVKTIDSDSILSEDSNVISLKTVSAPPTSGTENGTTVTVLSPNTLTQVIADITKSSNKEVSISMNGTTIVDNSLFTAIAGTDKTVSFIVNSNNTPLTWSFKSSEINKQNIKNIDLALNAKAPNESAINNLDKNAQVLSFKDNGVLPAPATLKIKVDSSKIDVSKGVCFYYYNPATKAAELISGPLTPDANGFVEVTIKHCSDYFMSNENISKTVVSSSTTSLPHTGSPVDLNVLIALGSCIILVGFILTRSKKFNK